MLSERVVDRKRVRNLRLEQLTPDSRAAQAPAPDQLRRSGSGQTASLEAVEREAYQKGFEAGRHSGSQIAEQKIGAAMERLSKSLETLAQTRSRIIAETETDLVRLALEIARKLVEREVRIDQEIILTLVQVAVRRLDSRSAIRISVSPEDHEFLQTRLKEDPDLFGEGEIELRPKNDLARGDCLVESDYGTVDARISEQFKQIEKELLSEF